MSSLPVAKGWLRRGAKALVSFTWPVLLTIVLTVIFMTAIAHFFGDIEQFREWQKRTTTTCWPGGCRFMQR